MLPVACRLSFAIDPDSPRPVTACVASWSDGLEPSELAELRALGPDHALVRRYLRLFELTLDELAARTPPEAFLPWLADIPEALRANLRRQGLDRMGVLYLLRHYPDLEMLLDYPTLMRELAERWRLQLRYPGDDGALTVVAEVLRGPLREYFWHGVDDADTRARLARRYGRLMLDFLACFPGRAPRRNGAGEMWFVRLGAPFLPHFFNSRWRFRDRLRTLTAFVHAASLDFMSAHALVSLFARSLKRREKVRLNHFMLLLERLEHVSVLLGKPSCTGLLAAAPSVRALEKQLRRMERRLREKLGSGEATLGAELPPEFPLPTLPAWPGMEPLLNPVRLAVEASYMQNCIATYEPQIRAGACAAWALAWPERCTVLVERSEGGWGLVDARTYGDIVVKNETWALLNAWLQGEPAPAAMLPPGPGFTFFERLQNGVGTSLTPYWQKMREMLAEYAEDDAEYQEQQYAREQEEADFLGAETVLDSAPVSALQLPERIGKWQRAMSAEELQGRGFEAHAYDPFFQEMRVGAAQLYFHPACRHFCACVAAGDQPADAVEFRRLPAPNAAIARREAFSLIDLQRMQELRDALARLAEASS